ncbi:PAS domain S-box protein [Chloroflexus sp.]|uniref:PAS domain S-box protein n=1 Tax=Chloroflexus sp. TaxID=1904827 RepID=UPI001770CADD|nr:PAS domain S-box protein [Chloroflexus sp.]
MNLNDNSTDSLLAECIAQRDRLRRIIETTNLLVVEIDAGGRITYINPACQRYFGVTPEECLQQIAWTFIHPEEQDQAREHFRALIAQQQPSDTFESRLLLRDGSILHLRWTIAIHYTDNGQFSSLTAIAHDIDQLHHMRTRQQLQEEELQTFKLLVELAPDGIAIADTQLRMTYTNQAFCTMLGYESLIGKTVVDITYPDDHQQLADIAKTLQQGQTVHTTIRYVRSDGSLITVQASALGLYNRDGQLTGFASINRDVTAQIEAEEELRQSEQRNRTLLAAMPDLMFLLSSDGVFLNYKPDPTGRLLVPPEMFLNRHVTEVLPPELATQILQRIDALKRSGEMQTFEYQIEIDNQVEVYEARMVLLQDNVMVLSRNITAQRQAERERAAMQEQIIQAQQATLRELSTPLMPIADGVVAMPLIGAIDSARAQQIMESLLYGVAEYKARVAIIDITGVKVVDTQVAGALIRAAQAARMLGAEVVLTGISPEIAQTLVHIGADLGAMKTKATLQEGIRYALAGKQ